MLQGCFAFVIVRSSSTLKRFGCLENVKNDDVDDDEDHMLFNVIKVL